jgi:hypothetical protein
MNAINSKRWIALAGGVLLLGSGIALAGAGGHGVALAPNQTPIEAVDANKLTAEDTVARSKQMQTQMTTTESRVASLQQRASAKKDMVQINCIADKLVQIRGYIVVGGQAQQQVEAAAARRDDGARVHNFERQTIVHQKVLVLGTEAEGCAGEDVSYVGATKVDVDVDPSIPVEDPTVPPVTTVAPLSPRPPEASPFA